MEHVTRLRPLRKFGTAAWLLAACLAPASAAEGLQACATDPDVVAACFDVRGRLSYWNGAPSARIWESGTTHLLGIHGDVLPAELRARMPGFGTALWGTYRVCPFSPRVAGHMQFVCIAAWQHLVARPDSRP